ncbi:3-dehydroquinate synthase [Caldicoprobacter guelmensis]|uniref:3-dehydroquinate synthase n=1 Tax=Caldicoprobacter guelmensis TaxID=1170224 RepID=UPI00195B0FF2|nr:3-dehydroquinate synthase [Caldicoprobacter guelmensis]
MQTITVDLKERSYPIYIAPEGWKALPLALEGAITGKKVMVVCDENTYRLYYQAVKTVLEGQGYTVYPAVIPPGESSKSFAQAQNLYTRALDAGLTRSSTIIALGGGVVGDLAGFIAATYMRGIGFIQIPTTLLAQVDSSIGGKVAINHPLAKNIIGAFYQPQMVFINPNTLKTLPPREFATGMAELIKHAFIADSQFISWLEQNMEALLSCDVQTLAHALYCSCNIKARVVERDEKESGLRMILNFGHTIGHAIESATGYSVYTHGEAVAMGMVYEAKIAMHRGLIGHDYVKRLSSLIEKAGLPTSLETANWKEADLKLLLERMAYDKKNTDSRIVFVLPTGYGRVDVFKDITTEDIMQALAEQ